MPESPLQEMDRQNISFVEKEWRASRIGMVAMVLIVVAALAGLFSVGPMSWADQSEPDAGIGLSYERLVRRGGPTDLSITMPAGLAGGTGTVSLWVSDEYLSVVRIDNIVPQPDKATSANSGILYDFPVASRDEDVDVTFSVTPHAMGPHTGSLGLVDGGRIDFRQFFYP